jgi:hypothetical protein
VAAVAVVGSPRAVAEQVEAPSLVVALRARAAAHPEAPVVAQAAELDAVVLLTVLAQAVTSSWRKPPPGARADSALVDVAPAVADSAVAARLAAELVEAVAYKRIVPKGSWAIQPDMTSCRRPSAKMA